LVYDLVVVDEALMVDSAAVLADLIMVLSKPTLELKKSYRFDGSIKRLTVVINLSPGDIA